LSILLFPICLSLNIVARVDAIRAATVGDVKAVKQWLTAPGHRHSKQLLQVLERATKYGHDIICQLVLSSADMSDSELAIALKAACEYNQQSIAHLIMKHGNLNTRCLTEALLAACVEWSHAYCYLVDIRCYATVTIRSHQMAVNSQHVSVVTLVSLNNWLHVLTVT
jgi:hypothetical protein